MSVELHRDTPVWEKCLTVRQCQGSVDSRTTSLAFRIIPGTRAVIGSSGQNERLYHFEITDEDDPYFLYVLDIGEQDFHLLKRDQALLVEFPVFPTKMVDLLNLCIDSENKASCNDDIDNDDNNDDNNNINNDIIAAANSNSNTNTNTNDQSKYIAKLDTNNGIFSIIECNNFKQLTHISLSLQQGNDNAIKSYLASRLELYMNKYNDIAKSFSITKNSLEKELTEKFDVSTKKKKKYIVLCCIPSHLGRCILHTVIGIE